uniref:Tachykinin n=1 Tax=Ophionotus victoriae TaxID=667017 RepID=A0A220W0E4_9ECHI|nr:tachykinin precursor [Ophionotus victoriae]
MASVKSWTRKMQAVALILCGVFFCCGQGQLTPDNSGVLNELTEFEDDTTYPDLDPDWIDPEDAAFLAPILTPDLTWERVPLQLIKRRKNNVFSAGLFGKRNGWSQGQQSGLFGKRNWIEEYVNGARDVDAATVDEAVDTMEDYGQTAGHYAKRQRWNQNQQPGLFGKRDNAMNTAARRTYKEMLKTLQDKVESSLDKRSSGTNNMGRVRTKSSGQHVFRSGGLFGKRSAEAPGMQRALWPENEQRRK